MHALLRYVDWLKLFYSWLTHNATHTYLTQLHNATYLTQLGYKTWKDFWTTTAENVLNDTSSKVFLKSWKLIVHFVISFIEMLSSER